MAKASERDRFKYGVCTNRDKDGKPCPKCASKEIQRIRIGQDFICEECKEPMRQVPPPKPPIAWGKVAGITAAILIIVSIGAYLLLSKKDESSPPPETIKVTSIVLNVNSIRLNEANKTASVKATVVPENATNKDLIWSSSNESVVTVENGTISKVNTGTAVVTVKSAENNSIFAECTITVDKEAETTKGEGGTTNEGGGGTTPKGYTFGRYEGARVNGIPEGQGTMYYTCRVQIAKHGRTTYYAEAGDTFVGTWGNGDIVNGNLYDRNNNQKAAILAGKRPNPYDLTRDRCE